MLCTIDEATKEKPVVSRACKPISCRRSLVVADDASVSVAQSCCLALLISLEQGRWDGGFEPVPCCPCCRASLPTWGPCSNACCLLHLQALQSCHESFCPSAL